MRIFSGNANKQLAEEICTQLGIALGKANVANFSDGETRVEIDENVRGMDVFIIQSTCPPVTTTDGAADHDRRAEARLGRPDHSGDSLLRLRAAGPQGRPAHPHLGQARGRPDHSGRGEPGSLGGSACRTDPGLFQHPRGPPLRHAGAAGISDEQFDERTWSSSRPTRAASSAPGHLPSGWMRRSPSSTSAARGPTSPRS